MSTLLAGAASVEITPAGAVPLFGYPHVPRRATGVHDPLLACALVLRAGPHTVVLVALDLLMLDPPTARGVRRAAAAAAGAAEACVLVSCTHTHSGPVTAPILAWAEDVAAPAPDRRYLRTVTAAVAGAVRTATERLAPARLAWTAADAAGVGGNRHARDGVTDSEAAVLAVQALATRRPLALAVVYGMHPTVLHEDSTLVSADFPHYTREALRGHCGRDTVVLYHTAPCGDQSPRYHVAGQTFAEAERLGRRLGDAVAVAVEALGDEAFAGDVLLEGGLRRVRLPRRRLPAPERAEATLAEYRAEFARLQTEGAERARVRTAECAVFGAEGGLALARLQASGQLERVLAGYEPLEVQAVRIGPRILAGLPGELFTDYALEIKRALPGRVVPVAFVNGELQGYIVTPAASVAGGYEAAGAVFAPAAGGVLVRAAVGLARQLLGETA